MASLVVTERSACSADSTAFKEDLIAHTFPSLFSLSWNVLLPLVVDEDDAATCKVFEYSMLCQSSCF